MSRKLVAAIGILIVLISLAVPLAWAAAAGCKTCIHGTGKCEKGGEHKDCVLVGTAGCISTGSCEPQ